MDERLSLGEVARISGMMALPGTELASSIRGLAPIIITKTTTGIILSFCRNWTKLTLIKAFF
jgi:hypothetical protein